MSENVKNDNVVHPADALAVALSRAGRLLAMLSDLYDANRDRFVTEDNFISHGISTTNELIDEAGRALVDLHEKCDLSLVTPLPAAGDPPADHALAKAAVPSPAVAKVKPPINITAAVETLQEVGISREPVAQSYPEFRDKITKTQISSAQPLEFAASSGEVTPFLSALRREMQ
jgi:hypothetical protein